MKLNNNKIWILNSIVLTITFMILLSGSNNDVSYAQKSVDNNSGSGKQLFCTRDFSNFINNGLDFNGEGFIDYWNDILVIYNTNYCQYSDIDSLLNRIDKARKQIRQAFYVCDTATATRVASQYYQLSAELYYLRHFVNITNPPNPKASEKEKALNVIKDSSVRKKFMNMFVNDLKYFDADTGNRVFEQLEAKYASKIEAYQNCSDPNLGMLTDRINNIKNTLNQLKLLGDRFQAKVEARNNARDKRLKENPGILSAFSAHNAAEFFNSVFNIRLNNEPIKETTVWEQISNTYKQNKLGGNLTAEKDNIEVPRGIKFNDIADDLSLIKRRDMDVDMDIKFVTSYDLKYRQVGGMGLDKAKVNLDDLKVILTDTFQPLLEIKGCTANIVGKQCGER